MDKEDIKTCKEEAENYIEFMETARDNAGWTRGLMWYIQYLEQKESILDKVTEECMKQMTTYEDSILEIFPQRILNIIEGEKK